jgi:hypothetical protein
MAARLERGSGMRSQEVTLLSGDSLMERAENMKTSKLALEMTGAVISIEITDFG